MRVVIMLGIMFFVMYNTMMKFLYMVWFLDFFRLKLLCFRLLFLNNGCDDIRDLEVYKKGAIFILFLACYLRVYGLVLSLHQGEEVIFLFLCQIGSFLSFA